MTLLKRVFTISLLLLVAQFIVAQDVRKAISLYESRKYDEAFAVFNSVRKGTPDYAESRWYMGMISSQQRDFSKAEEYTKQAISANGNQAKYHLSMAAILGQQAAGASTIRQATLAPKIKSHMETAAKLDPGDMNSRMLLLQFYTRAPKVMGGDTDKARKTADEIMAINRAEGYRAHATIDQVEEKFTEAERNYQRALNLAPDSLKHYNSLASFYQSRSKPEEALGVYDRAITRFPSNRNLLLQAGRIASGAGPKHHDKGVRYLNQYIEKSPGRSDRGLANAYYYLGVIESDRNNKTKATAHFNEALKINPEHRQAQQALSGLR